MKPDVLICDESVSALDVSVQAQVLNLLQDLQDEFHLSYIFISHDLAVVKYISDQIMVMNEGEIVEIADSDEIYRHPQQEYTQGCCPRSRRVGRAGERRPNRSRRDVVPFASESCPVADHVHALRGRALVVPAVTRELFATAAASASAGRWALGYVGELLLREDLIQSSFAAYTSRSLRRVL